MIAAIVAQLVGLFVDDGFLAAAILAAVAVAVRSCSPAAPAWVRRAPADAGSAGGPRRQRRARRETCAPGKTQRTLAGRRRIECLDASSTFRRQCRTTSPPTRPGSVPRSSTSITRSLPQILPFFPGLKEEDLPEGQGWAVARVHLTTRNGAHLDALSGEDRARLRRLDAGGCDYRS